MRDGRAAREYDKAYDNAPAAHGRPAGDVSGCACGFREERSAASSSVTAVPPIDKYTKCKLCKEGICIDGTCWICGRAAGSSTRRQRADKRDRCSERDELSIAPTSSVPRADKRDVRAERMRRFGLSST